ncbi:hypothetical protein GGS20DRAFT_264887 [Poronia punctata]|nr:hypothetical protein GGS20DRAFT_264887 [Poronia punctata]
MMGDIHTAENPFGSDQNVSPRSSSESSPGLSTTSSHTSDDDEYCSGMGIPDGFRPHRPAISETVDDRTGENPFEHAPAAFHSSSSSLSTLSDDEEDSGLGGIVDGFQPPERVGSRTPAHVGRPPSAMGPPVACAVSTRPSDVSKSLMLAHDGSARLNNGSIYPSHNYDQYRQDIESNRTEDSTDANTDRSRGSNFGYAQAGSASQLSQAGFHRACAGQGHTEPLPPYTEYPLADHVSGAPLNVYTALPAPTHRPTTRSRDSGTGGIGLATRDPEFSSDDRTGPNSPESRRSVRSVASEVSNLQIGPDNRGHNSDLPAVDEKEKGTASGWKAVARRKVLGIIPCWAIVLGLCCVILIVGVILAVILPRLGSDTPHNRTPYSDSNPSPGFIPLDELPPDLPELPLGEFSLTLTNPRYSNSCLKDPAQGHAWNCDAIMSQMSINVRRKEKATSLTAYALDIQYNTSYTMDSFVYSYGVQPPSLKNQQLELVHDVYQSARGPAWAFALPYTKTIVLPEFFLRRPPDDEDSGRLQGRTYRKNLAQQYDRPWICTWPETILQVFIYPSQNSTPPNYPMYNSDRVEDSAATSDPVTSGPAESDPVTESNPVTSDSVCSSVSTSTSTPSAQTTQLAKAVRHDTFRWNSNSRYSQERQNVEYHYTSYPTTASPTTSAWSSSSMSSTQSAAPSSATATATSEYFKYPTLTPPPNPRYPKKMKIEERRVAQPDVYAPTCRQVEIVEEGKEAVPVLNSQNEPVEVEISEVLARYLRHKDRYLSSRQSFNPLENRDFPRPKEDELSDCGCIWWVT